MSEMVLVHQAPARLKLPALTSTLGISALLGAVHLFVDATTVSVILRTAYVHSLTPSDAFSIVLAYDLLAFGSQVLFGVAVDRWQGTRLALRVGLALTCASVLGILIHPVLALLFAGFGNALFHLGAGAAVLERGLEKSAPSGVFVAPGAVGLAFGMTYGRVPDLGPLWPLALLSALGLLATTLIPPVIVQERSTKAPLAGVKIPSGAMSIALTLLLVSIAVRSLVGLSATKGTTPGPLLFYGVPLMAFGGKSLGGFLADRLGWIKTSVLALLAACPLIVFGAREPALLLAGLLLFQMTMPVTLTAVAQLMPYSLATGFGWTCLALIAGALPTMFGSTTPLCARPALFGWILISVIALGLGLKRAATLRQTFLSSTPA